jgi:hypothetical protein
MHYAGGPAGLTRDNADEFFKASDDWDDEDYDDWDWLEQEADR